MISRIQFISVLFLLLGLTLGQVTHAQVFGGPEPEEVEPEGGSCFGNFGIYLSSLLSFEEFKDYWADLLQRNRCQQDDIFQLQDQISELMAELREEYAQSCSSPQINEVQAEIRETKMELTYVRYIVPISEDSAYKDDQEAFESFERLEAQKDTVFSLMAERYVDKKGWVTREELWDLFYNTWEKRYEDRRLKWVDCNDSPWQEVVDKWRELGETMTELGEVLNPDSYQEVITEQQEELADLKAAGEKDATGSGIKGFFQKHTDFLINGLESKKALEQIKQEFIEVMGSGSFVTTQTLLEQWALEDERYKDDVGKAELIGKYTLLYKSGSADVTETMVNKIKDLRKVVQETTNNADILPKLIEVTKSIRKKQGGGIGKAV